MRAHPWLVALFVVNSGCAPAHSPELVATKYPRLQVDHSFVLVYTWGRWRVAVDPLPLGR